MPEQTAHQDPFLDDLRRLAPDVSFLGPSDSFSGIIANRLFGTDPTLQIRRHPQPNLISRGNLSDILNDVRHHEGELGILPYENSKTQPVSEAVDGLFSKDFHVLHEARLLLDMTLAGTSTSAETVREVYSHEKAISQSQAYIQEHGLIAVPLDSTSAAAEFVAQKDDENIAALCSKAAARRLGLNILAHGVQDVKHNKTRFLIIRSAASGTPDLGLLRRDVFARTHRPLWAKVMGIVSPVKPASQNGFLEMGNFMASWGLTVRVPTGTSNNESTDDDNHQDHLMEFEGKHTNLFEAFRTEETYRHMMKFELMGVFAVAHTYSE